MTTVHDSPSGIPLEVASEADIAARPLAAFWFGGDAGAYPGATAFLRPWQPVANAVANELTLGTIKAHRAGMLRNLRVALVDGGLVAADAAVIHVRINQANTLLTCTVAIGQNGAADLVTAVAVAVGDDIAVEIAGTPDFGSVGWATLELFES